MILSYEEAAEMLGGGIDPYDAVFKANVEAANDQIVNYCDRNFDRATYTEVLAGLGGNEVYVSHSPVESITSLWIDPSGRFDVGTLQTDLTQFAFEGNRISAYFSAFWKAQRSVKVTYVAGYWPANDPDPLHVPKMPADLRRACAKIIKQFVDQGLEEQPVSISLGSYSETFASPSLVPSNQLPFAPDVVQILDRYRRFAL